MIQNDLPRVANLSELQCSLIHSPSVKGTVSVEFLFRLLMPQNLIRPVLRPLTWIMVGLIAIPLFHLFMRRIIRMQDLDEELEKDREQWFRGSVMLLAATANMEQVLLGWVPFDLETKYAWLSVSLRLMLAINVTEAMPDQELFSIIHPDPPKPE